MIKRPDHFTIVTDQLEATRAFYVDLLGMREGPRPPFPVPGFWFYLGDPAAGDPAAGAPAAGAPAAGGHPALHVVGVERMPEPRRGALDHMAYWAEGLMETTERLRNHGIAFRLIRTPWETRTWQLFFYDPDGVEVELDFQETETPPADWKNFSGRMK